MERHYDVRDGVPAWHPGEAQAVSVERADLEVLARAASARLESPAAERRRTELLLAVNRAGRDASRRLADYTQHAVSASWGSPCTWDVAGDSRAFFEALAVYGGLVHAAAQELSALMVGYQPASPAPDRRGAARRPRAVPH